MEPTQRKFRATKWAFLAIAITGYMSFSASVAHATSTIDDILQISRPNDSIKNCPQLSQEISLMDEIMVEAENKKRAGKTAGAGVGVVQTVGSFMIGSLGGVLGIFAAGALIDNANDNRMDKVEEIQNAASQRRNLMAALYDVKGCHGPLIQQLANIEPAAGAAGVSTMGPPDLRPRKITYND